MSASAPNLFTVDLEEWFHVCGVGGVLDAANWENLPSRAELTTRRLLDLLDRTRVPATFFVVGWLAERFPHLVGEIVAAGHEVGSHSHWHRRVYELDRASFRADVRSSLRALRSAGAPRVTCFRAPEWSINERSRWALDILAEEGFTADASMAPLRIVGKVGYPRDPYVLRTGAGLLLELPPLVADRFGQVMPMGWGWGLRMSSPRRVLRTIEAVNRRGASAVLTIHPWEIDPDPPRVALPPALRFAHYFRLDGFHDRLLSVLSGAAFGRIGDLAV
jgi:polysaccharide deacetylase family protein (PEP-CTERM system associated)